MKAKRPSAFRLNFRSDTQNQAVGKNKLGNFLVIVQLIHRPTQADIGCTTRARLFFFPLLDIEPFPRIERRDLYGSSEVVTDSLTD